MARTYRRWLVWTPVYPKALKVNLQTPAPPKRGYFFFFLAIQARSLSSPLSLSYRRQFLGFLSKKLDPIYTLPSTNCSLLLDSTFIIFIISLIFFDFTATVCISTMHGFRRLWPLRPSRSATPLLALSAPSRPRTALMIPIPYSQPSNISPSLTC